MINKSMDALAWLRKQFDYTEVPGAIEVSGTDLAPQITAWVEADDQPALGGSELAPP